MPTVCRYKSDSLWVCLLYASNSNVLKYDKIGYGPVRLRAFPLRALNLLLGFKSPLRLRRFRILYNTENSHIYES